MMHRGLSFAVQYIKLDADDLCASYTQEREPGPLPNPRCHMEGKDGAAISIRRLLLLPDHLGELQMLLSKSLPPHCCNILLQEQIFAVLQSASCCLQCFLLA